MPKFHLVLLIHSHQPVGNFDSVIEEAYKLSYLPYVEVFEEFPAVPLTNVLIDGFNGSAKLKDGADEVTLDIEMALSMAPGLSSILVYEGPPPPTKASSAGASSIAPW